MTRGDVYEYTLGNARIRIVVVSADGYNPHKATYAIVIEQPAPKGPVASVVPAAPADPVRGVIDLRRLRPLVPDHAGARVGRLSRATMTLVDAALRTYLDL